MNKSVNKIAIVRLSALGDIVNSAIVLQFLHQHYPTMKIDWITEKSFAPLLQNHPYINKVHTVELKQLKKEKKLSLLKETVKYLCSLGPYDKIIDMQGLLKSSIVARLIGPNTHGFDKNSIRESAASFLYKTSSHISYDSNIIKRNCHLISDGLNFLIDEKMIQTKENIFPSKPFEFDGDPLRKNIAIVIGASWESKKYPKEKILELVNELNENCYIIWGNEEEKSDAQWISSNSDFAKVAPKFSLQELVSFISSCDLLIGNDTGPTHMAWAQNIPSITLFGPTNERMIFETSKNHAIHSPSKVDIFKINKNDFSIREIDVGIILNTAKELLQ